MAVKTTCPISRDEFPRADAKPVRKSASTAFP